MKGKFLALIVCMLLLTGTMLPFASADSGNDYLEPFISSDGFEGVIVTGKASGGSDRGTALYVAEEFKDESLYPTEDEKDSSKDPEDLIEYRLSSNTDFLESVERLGHVRSSITGDQFALLESGEFRLDGSDYDYDQYINPSLGGFVKFDVAKGVPDDENETPQAYLEFERSVPAYEYQFRFREPVEVPLDDADYTLTALEGKTLPMLGLDFEVTDTKHPAKNSLSLELTTSASDIQLYTGEENTISMGGETFTIKFDGASDSSDPAGKFVIDGRTEILKQGEDHELADDIDMTIDSMGYFTDTSLATISIVGSVTELTDMNITDGAYDYVSTYQSAGEELDGMYVKIEGTDDGLTTDGTMMISSISVMWVPEDTHYVMEGQSLSDVLEEPDLLFGNAFDIYYDGYNKDNDAEQIQLTADSDDSYTLSFVNQNGNELEIPLFYNDGGSFSRFGDADTTLRVTENPITVGDYFIMTTDGYENATQAKGITYLMEYVGLDANKNILTVENVATGEKHEAIFNEGATSAVLYVDGVGFDVSLSDSDNAAITVDLDNDGTFSPTDSPVLVTKFGTNIKVETTVGSYRAPYKQLLIYTTEKDETIAGDLLNKAFFTDVSNNTKNYLNYNFGSAFVGNYSTLIAHDIVETPNAVTKFYDVVRLTVGEDEGEIDITKLERCLDMGAEYQLEGSIRNTTFDSVMLDKTYQTLAEFTTDMLYFYTGGCFDTFTNDKQFMFEVEEDSDEYKGVTSFSTIYTWNKDDSGSDELSVMVPKNQLEQMVYYREPTAVDELEVSGEGIAGDFDIHMDDENLAGKNLILIGGPCVNEKAAEVLGVSKKVCSNGYEPGKGRLIKTTYEGNDVLVISGYDSKTTQLAAEALFSEKIRSASGDNLVVSGSSNMMDIAQFSVKEQEVNTPVSKEETDTKEKVDLAPEPVEYSGGFNYELKKFGITKDVESSPKVIMIGLDGEVIFTRDDPFEAQMGVDSLSYTVHIRKGGCNGEDINQMTFKWIDGDKDKEQSFTVSEAGSYCMTIDEEDIVIDGASVNMPEDGGARIEFEAKN
ncbi:MAG: hypothetical protein ACQESE_03625 [Nanobdellota archaeon]